MELPRITNRCPWCLAPASEVNLEHILWTCEKCPVQVPPALAGSAAEWPNCLRRCALPPCHVKVTPAELAEAMRLMALRRISFWQVLNEQGVVGNPYEDAEGLVRPQSVRKRPVCRTEHADVHMSRGKRARFSAWLAPSVASAPYLAGGMQVGSP